VSGPDGRFVFERVRPGEHDVLARTAAGVEARRAVMLPGTPVELVVGAAATRASRPRAPRGGARRR
jgi:hypothetical protein